MKPEELVGAEIEQNLLTLEVVLLATAVVGVIGSIFLREQTSKRAFWVGTAALIPFAIRMKKHEEAWHGQEENTWVRESARID